jgi:hypothetical protein
MFTAGDLKKLLKDVPDETPLVLYCLDVDEEMPIHSIEMSTNNQEQPAFCVNYY